jgi:hypothetical protein
MEVILEYGRLIYIWGYKKLEDCYTTPIVSYRCPNRYGTRTVERRQSIPRSMRQ